jgi:histidyl-tRNA synthetase
VSAEFGRLGLDDAAVAGVWDVLTVPEGHDPALDSLDEALDDAGREGVATLRAVLDAVGRMGVALDRVQIDPTLARGLDYYTGPVFEISLPDGNIGSVGGGGRYDGLIGMFSGRDVPAVGIALGIERIIVVLEEQGKLATQRTTADVLVTVFSDDQRDVSLSFATRLRSAGVKTDLYLGEGNLKKQLKYANARGYPNIVIIGPDESERGEVTVRNLESGEQSKLSAGDAVRSFTNS